MDGWMLTCRVCLRTQSPRWCHCSCPLFVASFCACSADVDANFVFASSGFLFAAPGDLLLPYLCETGEVIPTTPSASPIPSVSPRPVGPVYCLPGWTAYPDSGELEGSSSCLIVFGTPANYADATSTCAASTPGARLLTVNQGAIGNLALQLLGNQSGWVGATHNSSFSDRFTGWSWVDGTPSADMILNCGQQHCGAWGEGQPTYVWHHASLIVILSSAPPHPTHTPPHSHATPLTRHPNTNVGFAHPTT